MKILYIITQADGGGAQKYTLSLARHFGGSLAAGSEENKLFYAANKSGLKTFPLQRLKRAINPWNDLLAVWEIRQLIKTLQPDVVHLNSSKAGILGSFASIGLKKKVVFTAHGFVFNEPLSRPVKNFYLALEKTASGFRDYIICVSSADEAAALSYKLIKQEKISRIHNGLDAIEFLDKQQVKTALGLANDKIIIGCVANFYKTKGVDVLLDAIGLMDAGMRSKIQVALIGDGPEAENLKSQILNLKLFNSIKLLGKIDDAQQYLKAFDCLVIPSRKEGFPFVLLEAMQAGLPIVASNTGGIPESLGDAGFLVRAGDAKELAMVLSKTIADLNSHGPNYFDELSQKARARSQLFSREKMLEETKKVYEKILKE